MRRTLRTPFIRWSCLRALGYSDSAGGDFSYQQAEIFAQSKGIKIPTGGTFDRGDCVSMFWDTLNAVEKGGTQTLAQRMGDYILKGGVFGSVENRVAVDRTKTGGKLKNLFARAFLPFETMSEIYPPLKTHRWRLLYYELCRWCRLLFRGSAGGVWAELRSNQTISREKIRAAEVNRPNLYGQHKKSPLCRDMKF